VRTALNVAAVVMALPDNRAAIGTRSGFRHCAQAEHESTGG
jgi:hypothetical protein